MIDNRKLLTVIAISIAHSFAVADTVILTDGETLSGRISGENAQTVTIDTPSGRFTLNRIKIRSATRESPLENQKRQLEQYLASGKLDAAFHLYRDPELQKFVPSTTLDQLLIQHLKLTANAASATSDTAALLVQRAHSDPSTPVEVLLLASSLSVNHQNYASIIGLLQRIEARPPATLEWPGNVISALLDRIASAALRAQNGELLALSASIATRLPLSAEPVRNQLALYANIESLIRKKGFLEAAALFRPELFLHRADLFVPLGERLVLAILAAPATESSLAAMQSTTAIILPYVDSNVQLRALKYLVNRLIDTTRTNQAQSLADSYSASHPDVGAILQHLIEFRQRRTRLDPTAPLTHYKLASWARSMGLSDEAKSIFLELRADPRFSETVNLQLNLIENAQAKDRYARLRTLYDKDQYDRLQTEAAEFLQSDPPESFVQETKALLQLIDFEKWSSKRTSQGKAEAEFQQAERLAQRGEYDSALTQLNRIQLDRQDTAAAQKTQALRDRIMREKMKQAQKTASGTTTPDSIP